MRMRLAAISTAALLCLLAATPAAAQEGDLFYEAGWSGENCVSEHTVGVVLQMWSNGLTMDEDANSGFECAYVGVYSQFHALNQDRRVYAGLWMYALIVLEDAPPFWVIVGYLEDSQDFVGAGLGSVTVKYSAFIPEDYVCCNPFGEIENMIYFLGGDSRGFQYAGGDSRITQIVDVLNPATSNGTILSGPYNDVGLSTEYMWLWMGTDSTSGPTTLKPEAKNDWEWGPPYKTRWGFTDSVGVRCDAPERLGQQFGATTSTLRIHCVASARYPFTVWLPNIDWDYTLRLTFGNNGFDYELTGCHDGFPNHEAYLNGQAVIQFTHQTAISLFPPCESMPPHTGSVR